MAEQLLGPVAAPVPEQSPQTLQIPTDTWSDGDAAMPIQVLALVKAIARLEDVVEQETASLSAGAMPVFEDLNYRKSHGLLELTRAMRLVDPAWISDDLRDRLQTFRAQLERNRTLLKTHLDATREISAILTAAIRDAESDGTYSAPRSLLGAPQ